MLKPEERLLWQARPGLRTFGWTRALVLLVALMVPVLLGRWAWSSFIGGDGLTQKLLWSLLPVSALCFWGIPGIVAGSGLARTWVRALLGSVAVTDRRIVWLSPRRRAIYRQIDGRNLIAVALVDAERGWVAVTRRQGGEVSEIDLFGLPRPEAASAAIEAMMGGLAARGEASMSA